MAIVVALTSSEHKLWSLLVIWCSLGHSGYPCRFLTARGSVSKASQQLRNTLKWRLDFKPHDLCWDQVKDCATGGRLELLSDTDKNKRPIILYRLRWLSQKAPPESITTVCLACDSASHHAERCRPAATHVPGPAHVCRLHQGTLRCT